MKGRKSFSALLERMTVAMVVTISVLLVLTVFPFWNYTLNAFVSRLVDDHDVYVRYRLDSLFQTAILNLELGHAAIEQDIVDLSDPYERDAWFARSLNELPDSIYSFGYGSEQGTYYAARRDVDGEIQIMHCDESTDSKPVYYRLDSNWHAGAEVARYDTFDPRKRPWYQVAASGDGLVFSPIYQHFIMPDLVVSSALPVREGNGLLAGVLSVHVVLDELNGQLKEISSKYGSEILIVERDSGALVANSMGLANMRTGADGRFLRIPGTEVATPIMKEGLEKYALDGTTTLQRSFSNGPSHLRITRFEYPGIDWLILSVLPSAPYLRNANLSFVAALVLLAVATFVFRRIWRRLNRRMMKPVLDLVESTEAFAGGDRSRRASTDGMDEFARLSTSYNAMADELEDQLASLEEKVRQRTSELSEANAALTESRDSLKLILDSTGEAIFGLDLRARCTFANMRFAEMGGHADPADLVGRPLDEILVRIRSAPVDADSGWDWSVLEEPGGEEPAPGARKNVWKAGTSDDGGSGGNPILLALDTGRIVRQEEEILRKSDGSIITADITCFPQHLDGHRVGLVVSMTDITRRKRDEKNIRWLSYHDQLTGLFNRRFFEESRERLDNPRNWPITVLMVDMNGLKLINDALGHETGDRFLCQVAGAMRRSLRANDLAARVGGDEFIAMLPNADELIAEKVVRRIDAQLAESGLEPVPASVSMGYAVKRHRPEVMMDVIKKAEENMYRQKLVRSPEQRRLTILVILRTLYRELPDEEAHGRRVGWLAAELARELRLTPSEIEHVRQLGGYHDIGKIAVRREVLAKIGPLDEDEFAEVTRHSEIGYRILSSSDETLSFADEVLSHHERWDGRGYPRMTAGTDIPRASRMLHLVESYVAMTTRRTYAEQLSHEEALREILSGAGSQFDPSLVSALLRVLAGGPPKYGADPDADGSDV